MDYEKQDGIIVGEIQDKAVLTNPISKYLVDCFDRSFLALFNEAHPNSVHEVGCGTGRMGMLIRSVYSGPLLLSDFSSSVVRENKMQGVEGVRLEQISIYDVEKKHSADLVVCCEVLEHLERPADALRALRKLEANAYIFSVPREPIWRMLNLSRFRYVSQFGNTPGHLNHWSTRDFKLFVESNGFVVKKLLTPLPWTMLLVQ